MITCPIPNIKILAPVLDFEGILQTNCIAEFPLHILAQKIVLFDN
jgi:hypothetical protein